MWELKKNCPQEEEETNVPYSIKRMTQQNMYQIECQTAETVGSYSSQLATWLQNKQKTIPYILFYDIQAPGLHTIQY